VEDGDRLCEIVTHDFNGNLNRLRIVYVEFRVSPERARLQILIACSDQTNKKIWTFSPKGLILLLISHNSVTRLTFR